MLGTMSDYKLAKLLGVSTYVVKSRRKRLGIGPYSPNVWTEENLALLGTMPDEDLAALIGIKAYLVQDKRRALKIKRYRPADYVINRKEGGYITWTEEMIADLGILSDYKVAAKYGMHQVTVMKKRNSLGIPASRHSRWSPTVEWTPELEALLGTISDKQLGDKLGVESYIVRDHRIALGIKGYTGNNRNTWTEEEIALLGTMTDREVAGKTGHSEKGVFVKRRKLGIKAFNRSSLKFSIEDPIYKW